MQELQALLDPVMKIAHEAGQKIKTLYRLGQYEASTKSDNTPVTSADIAAHNLIVDALAALTPDIPILSEEDSDIALAERVKWQRYWLIDPLDGTQEFIAGSGEFAVNIALVEEHKPIMGVIYAPISGVSYYATLGSGAFKVESGAVAPIRCRDVAVGDRLRIAVSRRQRESAVMERLHQQWQYTLVPFGSASLKSCLVAEGKVDCYLRLGPTGEWDTAASQCIVEEAGGRILTTCFEPLSYNQRESLVNPNYLVLGAPSLPWQQILPPGPECLLKV